MGGPEGGGDGGDDLGDQPVQVGVGRAQDLQVAPGEFKLIYLRNGFVLSLSIIFIFHLAIS